MKVISYKDPIIVNGERISDPSDYLSADGEDFYNARGRWKKRFKKLGRIARYHPTVALGRHIKKSVGFDGSDFYDFDGENFSYIDKANTVEVKAFQNFVIKVKNDATILGNAGADGIWGTNTQKAYDKYGVDWEEYVKKAKALMGRVTGIVPSTTTNIPPTATTPFNTATTSQGQPSSTSGDVTTTDDKKKKTNRMLLYGGIGVAVLIIVLAVATSSKGK